MNQLQNDEQFPTVSGLTLEHGEVALPADSEREWTTLLYYRGEW